jgi:hypothetical protein
MSKWHGTGGLMLWIDVDPALRRETDAWYVDEHLPERVDIAGYRSARRYLALEGAPQYLSIFEADTPEALASEGYLGLVRKISEQSQRIRAGFSNVVRNTFRVRASIGRARGGLVGSLRLRAPSRDSRIQAEAAIDALIPQIAAAHGVVGAHWLEAAPEIRARLDAVRAVGQQDSSTDYALIIETTQREEMAELHERMLSAAALSKLGWSEDAFGVYQLMVEFS